MHQSLYTASTGLDTQQTRLSVIANNIANSNTVGFKKSRVNAETLMTQQVRQPGVEVGDSMMPSGLAIGLGTRVQSTQEIHSQGGFKNTGVDTDVAISGDGFFQVTLPTGEISYTRSGNFQLDGEGNLVTPSGYLLEPQIAIPENATGISISQQGVVSATIPDQVDLEEVGVIELAKFINPAGLENRGGNMYLETASSGAPIVSEAGEDGTGILMQGNLELSNVNVAESMVEMIETQRAYELASKVVTNSSDMISTMNDAVR